MKYPSTTIDLNGKQIIIESGRFGAQASGTVTVRCGDTIVFASVVAGSVKEGLDYFPLSIEYKEKLYASGIISSSRFIKREGRPTENEILTGRMIDRSIRPLFDQASRNDVQVTISPLSVDGVEEPEILSIVAASAAVSVSHYPWDGPAGSVRVGLDSDGNYIVNPTEEQKQNSKLDLVVSGTKNGISMVEAGANEVTEEVMLGALKFAEEHVKTIARAIEVFSQENGKTKIVLETNGISDEVHKAVEEEIGDIKSILKHEAQKTHPAFSETCKNITTKYPDFNPNHVREAVDEALKKVMRDDILSQGIRPDGRDVETIRPINIEVGLLPRTHGSAFFQRGLTHVLSTVTLASPSKEMFIEGLKGETTKRYFHHYNMPGFASGEVGRPGTGRREIGHGALAERAIVPMLPSQSEFPYTIRVVSEVMSSNGSTSQASVCGSALSLMDAGVPLKKPVAGVAMGLITEGDKYVTLTDICGLEDHLGDMDFKVAGTEDGITALQMDVKVTGVSSAVLGEALSQAKRGRLKLLEYMVGAISAPRTSLSQFAPKIVGTRVPATKIGEVIGSGGKVIRQIQEDYDVEVNINDDGSVTVTGNDQGNVDAARSYIESLVAEAEVGQTYQGTVARIEAFGAFVNILPGKDGLVHISQIVPEKFKSLKIGDKLEVRCYQVDDMGRVNLTTLKEGEKPIPAEPRRMGDGGGRRDGGSQGGFRRGGRPGFKNFRDNR